MNITAGAMPEATDFLSVLQQLHARIRSAVLDAFEQQQVEGLSKVVADEEGDTIYAVDRVSEEMLVSELEVVARDAPLRLVAEGLPGGSLVLPHGARPEDCQWRLIVDPIDGTRGIMYQKRSAWILSALAPERGNETSLSDVVVALQTEIPLLKEYLSDELWAIRGEGVEARRYDRLQDQHTPLVLQPSRAATIAHGFATISRFFPGVRDVLAAIDDEIVEKTVGKPRTGKAWCFEDQYASTGGQLYQLMSGRDRFVADIRPLTRPIQNERGLEPTICCHPYDICTTLIAEELGVIVTGSDGRRLDVPLDVDTDVTWIGYANDRIRDLVEPALQEALRRRGLLPATRSAGV